MRSRTISVTIPVMCCGLAGGGDRAKRITIATLQTMIAEYRELSLGYFDLVITDECHRSIPASTARRWSIW